MTDPVYVLKASRTIIEKGCLPTRVVLLKWYDLNGSFIQYSTHEEYLHEEGYRYYGRGHYMFPDRAEAEEDYLVRMKHYGTTDDPEAEMPEDVLFDHEADAEVFRTWQVGDPKIRDTYHCCLECTRLKEWGSANMIDTCEAHRQYYLDKGETPGGRHQRNDAEKILPRLCLKFEKNDKPANIVALRTTLIKGKIDYTKHYRGD